MTGAGAYDLAVIGGGINGCGLARDAAGRGLTVLLAERDDLASATSSASTKLIHGGLRYLEYHAYRLVREALAERETLWRIAPHLIRPLRFILPHHDAGRPAWQLRLGLLLYDHLGGRTLLPGTSVLDLTRDIAGAALRPGLSLGFEYSDCWVDDSRLVLLNAVDAHRRGADIRTRTALTAARRNGDIWTLTLHDLATGTSRVERARAVVNAAGPWAADLARGVAGLGLRDRIRLVRGSHIVVAKRFDHGRAYVFQTSDRRVCFVLPYHDDFTLIGTTDVDHAGDPADAVISDQETAYLCAEASRWLRRAVMPDDVVHRFSGVRPLYDDGAGSAQAATRDYVLRLDGTPREAPFLTILGGKLTTHRRLAERVMERLRPWFLHLRPGWTAGEALPGGGFPVDGVAAQAAVLHRRYRFLTPGWALRLVRAYGTDAAVMLGEAQGLSDLGRFYGATLSEREVRYLMRREWAQTAEDVLWRRSKLGLRLTAEEAGRLAADMTA